jgi:hypothetical protein
VYIAGTGITPFTALLKPDFQVETMLALQWTQLSNGKWTYIDRGASCDRYESTVTIYGIESTINNFITEIEDNRQASDNVIQLSQFNETEKIFGENVDHSGTIYATILKIDKVKQNTWKGFGLSFRLRAISPAFTGTSAIPTLDKLLIGYTADSELTINKLDSYTGSFTFQEANSDNGTFVGTFILPLADVKSLLEYQRVNRGAAFNVSTIAGVTYPFGKRRGYTFPVNCRIKEIKEENWFGVNNKLVTLTLVEGVTLTATVTALGQTSRQWQAICGAPNGDMYATLFTNCDIYKQTGGTGNFVALSGTLRDWSGLCAAPNGDIYASTRYGDIYKQTGGTGAFNALSQTSRLWYGMTASAAGDIYCCVYAGDIYKQTGGTGNFIALGGASKYYIDMATAPNGDIYAIDEYNSIYKQTGGTGSFALVSTGSYKWKSIDINDSADIYCPVYSGYLYEQYNSSGDFTSIISTNRTWGGVAVAADNSVYATVYNGDIYKITYS